MDQISPTSGATRPKSVAEWRKARRSTETWITPSGLKVELRRVSLLSLVEQGQIPTPLLGLVEDVTNGKSTLAMQELAEFMPLMNVVVKAVVSSPKVVDGTVEPDDDTRIELAELEFSDKLALFEWAASGDQEGAARLTKFLQEGT